MILKYKPKYFSEQEFYCKCTLTGCNMKGQNSSDISTMSAIIVIALDLIRQRIKTPVRVNSGRRCAAHNIAVGGVTNPISRHTKSEAADISAADYAALVAAAGPVCEFLGLRMVRYDKEKFLHIQEL